MAHNHQPVLGKLQGSFDVAVLQHVLCSVEDPEQLLWQARQRLKPGGVANQAAEIAFEALLRGLAKSCKSRKLLENS